MKKPLWQNLNDLLLGITIQIHIASYWKRWDPKKGCTISLRWAGRSWMMLHFKYYWEEKLFYLESYILEGVFTSNKGSQAKNQMPQAPRLEPQTFCWNRRRIFNVKANVQFLLHPRKSRDCREEKLPMNPGVITALPLSRHFFRVKMLACNNGSSSCCKLSSSESLSKLLKNNWEEYEDFWKAAVMRESQTMRVGKGLHQLLNRLLYFTEKEVRTREGHHLFSHTASQ